MHLLVTGGAGFIGANFIGLALAEGYQVTNLDALTYAANLKNCQEYEREEQYTFVKGSINDEDLLHQLFTDRAFDAVINFAAESHVDRSIYAASDFARTNVLGTVSLLETALRHKTRHFIQVSTDEVYGSLGASGKFEVHSPLRPSSPYSASKLSADHFALAFYHTHGMDVRITRCTNNYGRFQHPEKFIPTIIEHALAKKSIPVYGDGRYVRDWIYVDDHCRGVLSVLTKGAAGEIYLFGGSSEIDNNALVDMVLSIVGEQTGKAGLQDLVEHVTDRPGHDRRYAIDWSESASRLGWSPQVDLTRGLRDTIDWYLRHRNWWDNSAE